MNKPILIVEDDDVQREVLVTLLQRRLQFGARQAANGREAIDILKDDEGGEIKLVVLDVNMPVMGGMEALEIIRQSYPAMPVIMLTGSNDVEEAAKAMKMGATDFLTKPYQAERLAVTIKNALKISTLTREVSRLKHERDGLFTFDDLIGHDGGLASLVQLGRKAASSDIPVLLTGETGTGKEVFSKAIHGESSRAGKPFVAVNCGALPAQLIESTLFGHEKGSFTGASEKVIGKFREAEGGTIFLDEVGELPLEAQVKLLRVLQQKEVEPVGAGRAVPVNVRIISATNRDLQTEVEAGNFREDLFFRLNVLQLELLPLRDRREDIPHLARHFVERFSINMGAVPKEISAKAMAKLSGHDWPGNVRQLENIMQRALVVSDDNELTLDDFTTLEGEQNAAPALSPVNDGGEGQGAAIQIVLPNGDFKTLDAIEAEAVQLALDFADGNVTKAAKALGMAKSTFYKKMP